MLKYVTAIMIVLLLLFTNSFAQLKKSQSHKMISANKSRVEEPTSNFYGDYQARKLQRLSKSSATAQDLMYASLDWPYWNYIPTKLVMADITGDGVKDPIAIGESMASTRHQLIAYIDEISATSYALYGTDNSGNIIKTGYNGQLLLDQENNAIYPFVYDALTGTVFDYLWAIDLSGDLSSPVKVTSDGFSGSWPRAAYLGNGTFLSLADNDAGSFNIMKSTDGGVTFDFLITLGTGDDKFWFNPDAEYGDLPADPLIETNGSKISIICGLGKTDDYKDIYSDVFGTTGGVSDEDSANCMYHYYSTDAGATWQGEIIGIDGKKGQVANREEWARIYSWDIGSYKVDKSGVTHLVHDGVNSICVSSAGDTIWTFPLYYWNDKDKQWLSISNEAVENYYPIPDDDSFNWPSNFLSNSAPTVAVSENGNVVAAAWVMPEFSGEWGNSDLNIYAGDGGTNTQAVYYTDIAFAYSEDGGETWSNPVALEAQQNTAEGFPCLAPEIEITDTEAKVSYMYYLDPIPGAGATFLSSPQNEMSEDAKWVYNSKTITLGSVGVNDNNAAVKNYSLEQNYPNPFNPTTEIKFTLAKSGNVSLKVFDILGREVASLVNGTVEAGSHTINFNASNLSSGVYLYTINADNFTMTKKMMLMK
jgi:hypothetical protein